MSASCLAIASSKRLAPTGNELAKRRGYVSPVMARSYVTLREVRMLNNAREAELDDDGGHDV